MFTCCFHSTSKHPPVFDRVFVWSTFFKKVFVKSLTIRSKSSTHESGWRYPSFFQLSNHVLVWYGSDRFKRFICVTFLVQPLVSRLSIWNVWIHQLARRSDSKVAIIVHKPVCHVLPNAVLNFFKIINWLNTP